jgi:hypothetical protein
MNKRGQIQNPVIVFVGVVLLIVLIGPIFMKVFLTMNTTFGDTLGNMSGSGGEIARDNFRAVMGPTISFWDAFLSIAFFASILLLFISAFMIDTSPFWVVIYIISVFFLIIFTPNMMAGIDNIYNNAQFSTEVTYLPLLSWLESNFIFVLIGVIFITGVIIYGKAGLKLGGGTRRA